jgi:hypothetical protein
LSIWSRTALARSRRSGSRCRNRRSAGRSGWPRPASRRRGGRPSRARHDAITAAACDPDRDHPLTPWPRSSVERPRAARASRARGWTSWWRR